MRSILRYFRKKLNSLRKKRLCSRKQSISINEKSNEPSIPLNEFRYLGYYKSERLLPSSNQGLLVYDVVSLEDQTSERMLKGFSRALSPMDLNNDPLGVKIFWVEFMWRGQIPLYDDDHGGFHIPKRLKQTLKNRKLTVTVDRDFQRTISKCASITGENRRDRTWINPVIRRLMIELHYQGYAHSVEVWQENKLVGGLYGVSLGGYFTIESQFSCVRDASKIALVHLVARLRLGGYRLLDIDEITTHLVQFGAYELDRNEFLQRMKDASSLQAIWLGNDISSEMIQNEIEQIRRSKQN